MGTVSHNQGPPVWPLGTHDSLVQSIEYEKVLSFSLDKAQFPSVLCSSKVSKSELLLTGGRGPGRGWGKTGSKFRWRIRGQVPHAIVRAAGETPFCNAGGLPLSFSLSFF